MTRTAPTTAAVLIDSPAKAMANTPANTGSIVMMTEARMASSSVCAHVWMTNASAVAASAVRSASPKVATATAIQALRLTRRRRMTHVTSGVNTTNMPV